MTSNYDPKQDVFYKLYRAVITTYKLGGVALVLAAFVLVIVGFSPDLLYYVDAEGVRADNRSLVEYAESAASVRNDVDRRYRQSATDGEGQVLSAARRLPPQDASLGKETRLLIPKIGINAVLHTGENGEQELDKGVWMTPSFGTPKDGLPVLLSAHRFGGITWSSDYRRANSFLNLPQLENGDEIVVIYDQRKFTYRVRTQFESTNYDIDSDRDHLVLYTCKYLRSAERIFVTAERDW